MNTSLVIIDSLLPDGHLLTHFFSQLNSQNGVSFNYLKEIDARSIELDDLDIGPIRVHNFSSCRYRHIRIKPNVAHNILSIKHERVPTGTDELTDVYYFLLLMKEQDVSRVEIKRFEDRVESVCASDPVYAHLKFEAQMRFNNHATIAVEVEFFRKNRGRRNKLRCENEKFFTDQSLTNVKKRVGSVPVTSDGEDVSQPKKRLILSPNDKEILLGKIVEEYNNYIDAGMGTRESAFKYLAENSREFFGMKLSKGAIEGRYKRKK